MSILGQNVLTETVEYLDAGSIFDAIVTKKIAALNTSTQSNVDLFIGATGRLNFNVKGYNAFRFQQKSDSDKTLQMNLINNQGLEIIAGDNSRTTTISDITYTQSVSKHNIKSSKGVITYADDIEIQGSLTVGHDFLIDGAVIGKSTNMMRTFNSNTIGFGFRVDDKSNLELYKFDNITNITKKILSFGSGGIHGIQDTAGFPVYGSNTSNNTSGITFAPQKADTLWSSNGTDIYYSQGRIGVGTNVPLYTGHFMGTVFASNGFRDGTTVIQNGTINANNVIAAQMSATDGSGIQNITAANITIGQLQSAVMPNIITTNQLNSDVVNSIDLHINKDIFFNGNIYKNGELFANGDTGLFGYYSSNKSIYYTAGGLGIGLSNPKLSLDIQGIDAIRVPAGQTFQRPSSNVGNGMLRYNTTTKQFEGYGNSNWGSLGGLIDVNQDTYISAETTPGANNDQLKFYTSNIQRMIVNSNGKVGIATTNPSVTFDVTGTDAIKIPLGTTAQRPTASTGMLRYNSTTSQFEGFGSSQWTGLGGVIDVNQDTYISAENSPGVNNDELKFYTLGSQRMIINSTGNIGIGTTNPLSYMHVQYNANNPGLLITNGDSSTSFTSYKAQIALGFNGTNTYNHFIHTRHNGSSTNNAIDFYVSDGTSANTITAGSTLTMSLVSGKVGIANTNPVVSLDITGTDAIKIPLGTTVQRPTASTGMLRYNSTTSQFEGYGSSQWTGLGGVIDVNQDTYISAETSPGTNNDQLKFYTSNVQRMVIDSNGDVNVTTNFTTSNLTVTNKIGGHLIPSSNIAYDLGSPSNRWRDLYLSGNSFYLGDTLLERDATSGNITFKDKINTNIRRSVIVDELQISTTDTSGSNKVVKLGVNNNGDLSVLNTTTGSTSISWTNTIENTNSNMYYNKGYIMIGASSNIENYSLLVNNSNILKEQTFKVCNSSNYLETGSTAKGVRFAVDSSGYTTTKGQLKVRNESDSFNYITTKSDLSTVMQVTDNYINFSNLVLPSIYPITKINNNTLFAQSNIRVEFKANSTAILKISTASNVASSISSYNTSITDYLLVDINSNNYFTFVGSNLNYNINLLANIGNAKLGIGKTGTLTNSLEVNGNTNLVGDIFVNGNIYQNDDLINSSIFTKTSSNVYYNGHYITQSSNYTSSNSSTGSPFVTVMGLTDKFLDLSTLLLPNNIPLLLVNNYVFKATKSISMNLSGNIDGSTAYISTGPSNLPTLVYSKGANSNQQINLVKDQYLAILGF